MKFSRIVAAAAVAFCASQVGAQTITSVAATPGAYEAISGLTGTFMDYSSSVPSVATAPLFATGTYSVVTIGTPTPTATLTFAAGVTSFTFLWGSPDTGNSLAVDGVTGDATYFGNDASLLSSGAGNNAETRLVTITDLAGLNSLTFSTTKIAFEVAQVSAVPEPETYALMLAGLGAIGFVARRRKSV